MTKIKVCRTCTQGVIDDYFYIEGNCFASASLQIKDLLHACIPELDFDLLPTAVICRNCLSALHIAYQFKAEAIKNENTFRSKQHIRVKNFEALTKGSDDSLSTSSLARFCDAHESFEVELDNVEELKTELVYEDADDTNEAAENCETSAEMTVDIFPRANEPTNDGEALSSVENIEGTEAPLLTPVLTEFSFTENPNETSVTSNCQVSPVKSSIEENNATEEIEEAKIDVKKFIQRAGIGRNKRDINRPYKCNVCHFRSDARASLIMHSRIHTGEKPFHCEKCSYRAKRKAHLDDHMKIHTGERPFKCIACGKSFITKQILKKHSLIHTGEKPYRCMQCNFRSRHKLSIANHVKRVHIGMSKVSLTQRSMCYVCGKCLAGPTSLSTHMKIHTGVKSHLCELCGRYFREKGMLKNHLQVHTGEKPFKCTACDYIATRKAHLQDHMRTHVDQRKLAQCTECEKRYTTKLLLRKHMKGEHAPTINEQVPQIFGGEPPQFIGGY